MKLNNTQKILVEDNYGLIYKFAKEYHLDMEDYYDVLAIGLCQAAMSYNPNSDSKFSTYAFAVMRNYYFNTYRSQYGCKRNEGDKQLVSYNDIRFPRSDNEDSEYLKYFESQDEDILNSIIASTTEQFIINRIKKPRHKQIAKLLFAGFSQTDTAKIMNVSHTCVYHVREKIKAIYNQYNRGAA